MRSCVHEVAHLIEQRCLRASSAYETGIDVPGKVLSNAGSGQFAVGLNTVAVWMGEISAVYFSFGHIGDVPMSITYSPDVGLHGKVATPVDANSLRAEPSLTLCTIPVFARWAGPISHRVFSELIRTTGFQRIAARAHRDPTLSIRISVYAVWLEAGDFPSQRPDWHIDRIGGYRNASGAELVDLRDATSFPSFLLTSIFLPTTPADSHADSRSSEFLLSTFDGTSGELWADMMEMHLDIDGWLAANPNPPILKAGNRTIVSFSPRTVHRPGCASTSGWSYMLRLGLYTATEPCSPYPDHLVFFNPVWNESSRTTVFRRVGSTDSANVPPVRSVPLAVDWGEEAAIQFLSDQSLHPGRSNVSYDSEVKSAALLGLSQVAV